MKTTIVKFWADAHPGDNKLNYHDLYSIDLDSSTKLFEGHTFPDLHMIIKTFNGEYFFVNNFEFGQVSMIKYPVDESKFMNWNMDSTPKSIKVHEVVDIQMY